MRIISLLVLLIAGCDCCGAPPAPDAGAEMSAPADLACHTPCGYFDDGGFGRCPAALPGAVCIDSCCLIPNP